ncbi:MAG: hypothetical protein MOGMAGMI_00684 [Candidatus Omnitrophica bacterium]|nr:hypothetical protein [Candidatus Omnitrophota bacterium]
MAYLPGRKGPEEKRLSVRRRDDIDLQKLKRSHELLEDLHRQMRESHIEMILNLATAAEYKDPDTGNHILRISDYATELGKAAGLSEQDVDLLRFASPMHDIGKIGIPDSILQKPGKLTPEEWEVMKTHTVIGSRIFQNSRSPLLRSISQISLTHHEKYDGSGYPNGLKGEEIPIFGRIVAVVDVFDAIVSKRCYKEASSFDEGFAYIESLAGTHLDPHLIKVFRGCGGAIRQVYDANQAIAGYIKEFAEQDLVELDEEPPSQD